MTRKRFSGGKSEIVPYLSRTRRPPQRIWGRESEAKGYFADSLILTMIICRQTSQGREKVGNK